jgi:hypothetical protein
MHFRTAQIVLRASDFALTQTHHAATFTKTLDVYLRAIHNSRCNFVDKPCRVRGRLARANAKSSQKHKKIGVCLAMLSRRGAMTRSSCSRIIPSFEIVGCGESTARKCDLLIRVSVGRHPGFHLAAKKGFIWPVPLRKVSNLLRNQAIQSLGRPTGYIRWTTADEIYHAKKRTHAPTRLLNQIRTRPRVFWAGPIYG